MKKILIMLAIISMANSKVAQAQSLPDKAFDVEKKVPEITKEIGSIVGGFTPTESTKVGAALKSFLGDYNKLIPLLKSNPAEFTKQVTAIKNSFNTALQLGLAANKLKKFTGSSKSPADAVLKLL